MLYRLQFVFAKKDLMKYISHLDLMRLFMRALRRAGLPVKITEGFHPHPKLSISRALKLGLESDHEEGAITLVQYVKPEEFIRRLQAQLPKGIEIREAGLACQKKS